MKDSSIKLLELIEVSALSFDGRLGYGSVDLDPNEDIHLQVYMEDDPDNTIMFDAEAIDNAIVTDTGEIHIKEFSCDDNYEGELIKFHLMANLTHEEITNHMK